MVIDRAQSPFCYLATTHDGREDWAVAELSRQKFECFAPKVSKEIRRARKLSVQSVPLIPGHIFIMNPHGVRWQAINNTLGVKKLFMDGSSPKKFDTERCENFIAKLNSDIDSWLKKPSIERSVEILNWINSEPSMSNVNN